MYSSFSVVRWSDVTLPIFFTWLNFFMTKYKMGIISNSDFQCLWQWNSLGKLICNVPMCVYSVHCDYFSAYSLTCPHCLSPSDQAIFMSLHFHSPLKLEILLLMLPGNIHPHGSGKISFSFIDTAILEVHCGNQLGNVSDDRTRGYATEREISEYKPWTVSVPLEIQTQKRYAAVSNRKFRVISVKRASHLVHIQCRLSGNSGMSYDRWGPCSSHSRFPIIRDTFGPLLHIQKPVDFLVIKTRKWKDWVTTYRVNPFLFWNRIPLYSSSCPGTRHVIFDSSELDTILPLLSLER